MLPELGFFAIILALFFSLLQFATPLWGHFKNNFLYFQISKFSVFGQFIFLSFAMFCLIISFILNDMTVIYIREHSHHLLPFIYRAAAAWGGHEGSLLLWCCILSAWTVAFTVFRDKDLPQSSYIKIIATLGLISAGFIIFLFFTSNPFKRDFPIEPITGNDLTPLLQDPGLLFHPPALYFGYVGFAIGFAFAIAALLEGELDEVWSKACRPWVLLPWAYLGGGIVLGSWWAYRELGWGGWWFWDPVENASLLPWLSATAFIHSLIVSQKRGVFKGWTLLLAIITFALSLIGTFLVRSGVLVSVHTFASDPARGIFLLVFLTLIIGGAFLLYSIRIKNFYQPPRFHLLSRETILLANSTVLLIIMAAILIGTLYPIILDSLSLEKISVGEPYFNLVFVSIMLPLLLLMGFAPHMKWGQESWLVLWKKMRFDVVLSILGTYLGLWIFDFEIHWFASVGIIIGIWIIISTVHFIFKLHNLKTKITLSHWAMIVAHVGVAICLLGITINKSYSEERQVKIYPGEKIILAGYDFTFTNLETVTFNNYRSLIANFWVQNKHHSPKKLSAEQRTYFSHEQTLNIPGILFNVWRDFYLSLGTPFPHDGWSVRIYYKPCVRWIWFGGFLLLIGGLLSLLSYHMHRGCESNGR